MEAGFVEHSLFAFRKFGSVVAETPNFQFSLCAPPDLFGVIISKNNRQESAAELAFENEALNGKIRVNCVTKSPNHNIERISVCRKAKLQFTNVSE